MDLQNRLAANFKKSNSSLNQSIHTPSLGNKTFRSEIKNRSESYEINQVVKSNNHENESYSHFTNCVISFIHPQCFFIQKDDFDEELNKIQPEIDDCLDPYDSKQSYLCIGQFKEDNLFYRCRILHWYQKTNEAECLFIDFGNIEFVTIDTITKMSDSLKKVKSLAWCCKLKNEIDADSEEFEKLRKLVQNFTKFDVRVRTSDLERSDSAEYQDPIPVELCTSIHKTIINKENLKNMKL